MARSVSNIGFLVYVASCMSSFVAANPVASAPDAVSFIQAWGQHNSTNWRQETASDFDEETVVDYRRMLTKDYVITYFDDADCSVESKLKGHELVRVTQNVGCYDMLKRKAKVETFKLSGSFRIVCTTANDVKQLIYNKASCRGNPIDQKLMKWDFFKGHCENQGRLRPALRSKHFPDCKRDSTPTAVTQLVVPDVPWCFDPVNRRPCDDVDSIGLMKPIIHEEKKLVRTVKTSSLEAKHTPEKIAAMKKKREQELEARDSSTSQVVHRDGEGPPQSASSAKKSITVKSKSKVAASTSASSATSVITAGTNTSANQATSAANSTTSKAVPVEQATEETVTDEAEEEPVDLNKPET